jgi:hypothetical protein
MARIEKIMRIKAMRRKKPFHLKSTKPKKKGD